MILAVNYSNNLIRLIREKKVVVDLIKCPDWEGMLEEARPFAPVTIHFDLKAGLGKTTQVDPERLRKLKEKTVTPHINTHLVAPRNFNPENQLETDRLWEIWLEEIGFLVHHFGREQVALEHYPYTENNPHLKLAVMPDVFGKIIQETDCQFLLDLAHARITANSLGMDVREYIRSLPLSRLVEIHITGIKNYNGVLTDHFEMTPEDWQLLDWVLENIANGSMPHPRLFAFEYGGVGEVFAFRSRYSVLEEQLPRLYEKIHQLPHEA
jgi:hypothetical protein